MDQKIVNILCNQIIDIAKLNNELVQKLSKSGANVSETFANRNTCISTYVQQLFGDYNEGILQRVEVVFKLMKLMLAVYKYRDSYKPSQYAWVYFNSILDILDETYNNLTEE